MTAYRGANGEYQKECSDRLDRVLTAGRGPVAMTGPAVSF